MARSNTTYYLDLSKRPGDKDSVRSSDWYVAKYDELKKENANLTEQNKKLKEKNARLRNEAKKMADALKSIAEAGAACAYVPGNTIDKGLFVDAANMAKRALS